MGIFVYHLDLAALVACFFCKEEVGEILFQAFLDCPRLWPLFATFITLFGVLDLGSFCKTVYTFFYLLLSIQEEHNLLEQIPGGPGQGGDPNKQQKPACSGCL